MFFKRKCPTCGAKNPKENMTCESCGTPLVLGRGEGRVAKEEAEVKRQFSTRIDSERLCLAINQVVFAASSDSSKGALTGIMAEFDGYKLTLAAADGFRLAVHKTSLNEPVANKEAIIIPVADLQELSRYLVDVKDTIDVEGNLQANQVVFRTSEKQVTSQLIKGTYPAYGQLIPSRYATRVLFSTSKLSEAISSFVVKDSEVEQIVRLRIVPLSGPRGGKLLIEVTSQGIEEIAADVEGKENRIAFSRLYLSQGLHAISEDKVALDIVNATSPGVIHPVGMDNFLYVLMPMFVQW